MKKQTLGEAMVLSGRPPLPQRPMMHVNRPPTQQYRENHPTLTSPAATTGMNVKDMRGPSSTAISSYVKALQGGAK